MSLEQIQKSLEYKQYPIIFEGHWMSGEWVNYQRAQELSNSYNPSSGKRIVIANTSHYLDDQAIEIAHNRFDKMNSLSFAKRFDILRKFKQVLADYKQVLVETLRQEAGKTLWDVEHDFESSLRKIDEILSHEAMLLDRLIHPYSLDQGAYLNLNPLGVLHCISNIFNAT